MNTTAVIPGTSHQRSLRRVAGPGEEPGGRISRRSDSSRTSPRETSDICTEHSGPGRAGAAKHRGAGAPRRPLRHIRPNDGLSGSYETVILMTGENLLLPPVDVSRSRA